MDYGQAQNEAVEAYFDREARDRKSQEQRGGNEVNRSMLRVRQGRASFLPGDHLLRLQNKVREQVSEIKGQKAGQEYMHDFMQSFLV
jgi:hypothetical protein